MLSSLVTFALLSASVNSAIGAVVDYNFDIRNVNVSPDGFERSIVSVNGHVPGTFVKVHATEICVQRPSY
jgi:hypothetical protein